MPALSVLKSNVAKTLGLDETASSTEDVLLLAALNEAVLQVLARTQCYVASIVLQLTSGTTDYLIDISADTTDTSATGELIAIKKIIDSASIPMEQVSPEQIYDLRRAAATATIGFTTRLYAVEGGNRLLIWPTPSANETCSIYGVPRPAAMTTGTDNPSVGAKGGIPEEWHRVLELYALAKMANYDDDATSRQGQDYLSQYEFMLGQMRAAIRNRHGRKMPPVRMARRRSGYRSSMSQDDLIWN